MTPIENYFTITPSYLEAAEQLRNFSPKEYQCEVLLQLPLHILKDQRRAERISQAIVYKKLIELSAIVLNEIRKTKRPKDVG